MTLYIHCGSLIDGTGGAPADDVVLVVEGQTIVAVGRDVAIPAGAETIDAAGFTVMPGLIDAHLHLTGGLTGQPSEGVRRPGEVAVIKAAEDAKRLLAAGFTTVKDCGGTNAVYLKKAAAEGTLTGIPRIVAAGYCLSQTGGLGDDPAFTVDCVDPRETRHIRSGDLICDGVPECLKAARYALRFGADFIKVMASGAPTPDRDSSGEAQFLPEELTAIVAAAAQPGTFVTAHSLNAAASKNAILAGVKTIDHADETTDELIALARESGTVFVATLTPFRNMLDRAGAGPVKTKHEERWRSLVASYNRIRQAGLPLAMGTDQTGRPDQPMGDNARELELLADHTDFTPLEVIAAATKHAAAACFLGDRTGTIEPGKWADLIVVDGDPSRDIAILRDIEKIRLVMLRGRIEVRR